MFIHNKFEPEMTMLHLSIPPRVILNRLFRKPNNGIIILLPFLINTSTRFLLIAFILFTMSEIYAKKKILSLTIWKRKCKEFSSWIGAFFLLISGIQKRIPIINENILSEKKSDDSLKPFLFITHRIHLLILPKRHF